MSAYTHVHCLSSIKKASIHVYIHVYSIHVHVHMSFIQCSLSIAREERRGSRERGNNTVREGEKERGRDKERDQGYESSRGSRSARARDWEVETPQGTSRGGGDTPYTRRHGEDSSVRKALVCV